MKKKVWILNHYATNMYFNEGGRHYWFAEYLNANGYDPVIFCANTRHNHSDSVKITENKYTIKESRGGIPFIFVKTSPYDNNGIKRIRNMISFYKNILSVGKKYTEIYGKPDIIVASSVHPLTLVAGIQIAKKLGIPCLCEVRDLWPESIVAYGALKRESIIAKLLYSGEKWIYKKANKVIMTWPGGRDYILDKGWESEIDLNKITHISNGVTIDSFDRNCKENRCDDPDLFDVKVKNFVYAGSIRKVNNLGLLISAAKIVQDKGIKNAKFLIYGSGDQEEMLKKRCERENISNVIFKGRVEKKYIPSILSNAYANILHNTSTSLDKYGQSQNKFFEYLASGKGIIQTYTTGYSVCEKFDCGISVPVQKAEEIASAVIDCINDEDSQQKRGKNARKAALEYDFKKLTNELIKEIENV